LAKVTLVSTRRFADARGYFAETYNRRRFSELGIDVEFVQDNQSFSRNKGTVRGLHYQSPPHAQAKLVSVLKGRILDVAVDVRNGSPTYGRHVSAELSAENGYQLFIPVGYLHGFVTLEPESEVAYKVTDFYHPASEGGVSWLDPDLGIEWGVTPDLAVLSERDAALPFFTNFDSPFDYDGAPMDLRTVG
jgi:dTDP-4-dehydrorhamnose 3,5-epimerase